MPNQPLTPTFLPMHTLEQLRDGKLRGVRRLQLACGLRDFPPEIFELAETLEILDLSGNALSSLPDDLPRLGKLRVIFCSDNQFTALPEVLGQCRHLTMVGFKANRICQVPAASLPAQLRWLILTDNRIEVLPDEIGRCTALQKLMLAGNQLRALPASLAACTQLELLRVAANQLAELPDWLLTLPRLSWLAYAGNPFAQTDERAALVDAPMDHLDWDQLVIGPALGEGASGVIYRATQRDSGAGQPVAVKLFKGAVTSDGLPHCEMAACIASGRHPNLIPAQARVNNHPAAANALVMPLIDPAFSNLAGPPSLESCTRDVYPADLTLELPTLLAIAHGIASAAAHLHARGILHGDLYGHNILHCGQGRALLGDFGAASFFTPGASQASALQRLEVRAFGCLLEELIERCPMPDHTRHVWQALDALRAACLGASPAQRPLFAEIERSLAALAAP